MVSDDDKAQNTFTFAQKRKLENKEAEGNFTYTPQTLTPEFADDMRVSSDERISSAQKERAASDWMRKLKKGDYSGPTLDRSRYLNLRNTLCDSKTLRLRLCASHCWATFGH